MRVSTSDGVGRWTRFVGLAAMAALGWAVFVPDGAFWTAALAAGLVGSAIATAFVARSRRVPSLAQVIENAEREPIVATGGEREP